MPKTNVISDEHIVAALMQAGSVEKAAIAAGCSTRTIYDRMQKNDFQGLYANAKADLLRGVVFSMQDTLLAAVQSTKEIMQDPEVNPAVRLQAAQTILNNAGKYTDLLTKSETAAYKANCEPFDWGELFGAIG